MYMQQQHPSGSGSGSGVGTNHGQGQGQDQGQNSGLPSPHPNNNQHQFSFDQFYPGPYAGPSTSTSTNQMTHSQGGSYDYSYSRGQQHDMGSQQQSISMDTFQGGMDDPGWSTSVYGGGPSSASASTSQERSTSHQHQHQHSQSQQSIWPPQSYDLGSTSSSPYPYGSADPWGQRGGKAISNAQWPDEYVEPSGPERELSGLQMALSDLVESIRPHATSFSNPRPPKPSPYLQARFLRLASTVQTSLSNLQPHLHQTLHLQFNRPPPKRSRTGTSGGTISNKEINGNINGNGTGNGTGNGAEMTAAEKEMEVIRKRRDMLIARAAQVQASSHPSAVHQSQLPANWNHGELYQNGGGIYGSTTTTNNNLTSTTGNTNGLAMFASNSNPLFGNTADSPSLNSSRRSTITLENFDTSLARFSLDPTKIGQNGYITANANANGNDTGGKQKLTTGIAPDGGRCHGCGASVTPEWRMGPDGPRSLCNACGLHYAKITKRRAQESANTNPGPETNGFPPPVPTPVGF